MEDNKLEQEVKQDIQDTVAESPAVKDDVIDITPGLVAASRYTTGGGSAVSQAELDDYLQRSNEAWAKMHEVSSPVETPDYTTQPTKYINTTGYRSTEGLKDVVQYESDVPMPGLTPVGGGYGGTGIQSAGQGAGVPGSDLNEMTGDSVNDFFWKTATMKPFPVVDPFAVSTNVLPGVELKSTTTDIGKNAFVVATSKQGVPLNNFFGYENLAATPVVNTTPTTTPWYKALVGGVVDIPNALVTRPLAGLGYVGTYAAEALTGKTFNGVRDYLNRQMQPALDLQPGDSMFIKGLYQTPSLALQVASLYFSGVLAAAAKTAEAVGSTASGSVRAAQAVLGHSSAATGYRVAGLNAIESAAWNGYATQDMPITSTERLGRMTARGAVSFAANAASMWALGGIMGRAPKNILAKKDLLPKVGERFAVGGITQTAVNTVDTYADYRFRNALSLHDQKEMIEHMTLANYMAWGLQGIDAGFDYAAFHSAYVAQQGVFRGVLKAIMPLLKTPEQAVNFLMKNLGIEKPQAELIAKALDESLRNGEFNQEVKEILDGALDKANPEALRNWLNQFEGASSEKAKEAGKYLRTQFEKDVLPKIGEGFSDSERMAIVGLMKGIASIMTYVGIDPRSVAGEMFSVKRANPGEGSSYVPKERTVYVAQDVGSIGLEIGMLTDTAAKSNLTPQSRSLLHEIGHGLDHMLSRADSELNGTPENTEPGLFAEWLPKYFDAIKKAFGPKVSEKVEALATNDRVKASGTLGKKLKKQARKGGTDKDVQLADTPEATSEYFAYALSHLTREQLFDLLGLTGAPAEVMDALVAMSTSDIVIPEMQKQLNAYKQSLVNTMKQNKTLIDQVLKEYNGDTSELKAAVEKFVAGDTDALSLDNLQKLADIVESFIDGETAEVVGEVFENISVKTFSEQAREEINSGLEEASPEQNEIVEDLNKRLRDGVEVSVADAESSKTKSAHKVIDKDLQQTLDDMEPTEESGKDIFDLSEKDESSDETLREVSRDPDAALLASLYAKLDGKRVDTTLAHKLEDKLDGKTLIESQDDVIDAISNAPKGSKLYTDFTLGKYTGSVMDVLHAVNPALEKMFPVGRVSSARNQISNEHMRGWEAKAKEIVGGDNEYRKWTIDSQLKRYKTTKNLIGGKTAEVELSKQQLMSAYELLKQSDAGSNARIIKSYPEIKSLIDKNLTSQDKAVADMTQQHLQGIFDRIKDILSDEDNIDLGKIENYFPIYDVIKTDTGTRINSAKARSVTNGRYAGGIEAQPIFEVLQRYVEWAANVESGYTRTLRRMKDVFNYKSDGMYKEQKYADLDAQAENNAFNIRQALRERYGENMVEKINSEVSDLLDQHPVYTPTGAFASATNTLVSNAISWNILSLPKNLLSNMFIGMTEPGAFASFLKGLMAPRATYEDMIRYRAIADRLEGVDIDDLLNTATRSQGVLGYVMNNTKLGSFLVGKGYEKPVTALMAYSSLFKKLGQKTFMQFGDALGLVYGLKPTVDKMRAQGFNDAQINAELTRKIQEFTSTADKATEPKAIRDIKRTGVGPLLAFKKDLAIKSAKIARDLVDAYRGDSVAKQAAARDIAAIILSIGVFSAISAGVWDLWSDDEDVRKDAETAVKREVLSTMLGYNPMVSALGEPMAEYALGFGGTSGYSSPILSFGNNYIKDLKKDRKFNIAIDTATLVAGMPGLPKAASESQGLVGAIFGDYVDERERDYYTSMALGRTENYASKRSGYDPKQVDKTDEND